MGTGTLVRLGMGHCFVSSTSWIKPVMGTDTLVRLGMGHCFVKLNKLDKARLYPACWVSSQNSDKAR